MNDVKLIGEVTPEQIQAWKEQVGDVFAIKTGGHICYLKRPDRKTLSSATAVAQTNPLGFNETILRGCWLGGSEAIRNEDKLFLAACGKLGELIQVEEAALEKF